MHCAVNIGNMLMRLSDNLLKSTYHRVRAPLPCEVLVSYAAMHSDSDMHVPIVQVGASLDVSQSSRSLL